MKRHLTVKEIIEQILQHRPFSRESLYVHLRALRIKPLGVRQSPQRYPADTADRLLTRLGFKQRKARR